MKRGKVLVVVALGLSLALGGVASPSQGATALQSSNGKGRGHSNDRHDDHGRGGQDDWGHDRDRDHQHPQPPPKCSYPPVRTPAVWLGAWSDNVRRGETFRLSGTVKVNSCGLPHWTVGLYVSDGPNGPYNYLMTSSANDNGEYSFYWNQQHTHWFKVGSAAGDTYNAAMSGTVTVNTRR